MRQSKPSRSFPRKLALAAASILVGTVAYAVCTIDTNGGSTGAVFSVFENGYIDFTNRGDYDQCNLTFLGGSVVNAQTGHLYGPGAAQPSVKACKDVGTGQVVTVSGKAMQRRTLDTYVSNTATTDFQRQSSGSYTLPAGTYRNVSLQNGASLTLTPDTNIKSLSIGGCNGNAKLTFAPGKYFIENMTLEAQCNLEVSGSSGTVVLNFLNPPNINGGPTCVNITNCAGLRTAAASSNTTAVSSILSAQSPERLQMNIYTGNMSMQNNVFIAAGIYLDNGNFFGGTGPLGFVGEILGANVTVQNNTQTYYYSKTTSMPGSSTPITPPVLRTGFYTLSPAAVPARATVGDYVFVASQKDVTSTGTAGTSGHLLAFALKADGSLNSTPAWDFADEIVKLASTAREAKLFTTDASGNFVTLRNADSAAWGASNPDLAMYPNTANGAYLAGRDPASLVGRPWRTAPQIIGQAVVFATDDGFLYSVNRTTGALNWAWMPRQILPLTATPKALMDQHPWGQIGSVQQSGVTYITGTALSGALHFSLRLKSDGTPDGIAWQDYRTGKSSPSSPFGGAAPTPAARTGSGTQSVAYVVDNKLVVRSLDGTGTVKESTLSTTVTSNLLYLNQDEIYYGDTAGNLQVVNSSGTAGTSPGSVGSGEAILSINGAYLNSSSGNTLSLLAQTLTRVSSFKRVAGAWSAAWYSAIGSSSTGSVPSISVNGSTAGLYISAPPTIADGKVYVPVTRSVTSKDECGRDVITLTGYVFGPLDLTSGSLVTDGIKFRGDDLSPNDSIRLLGDGESLRVTVGSVDARSFVYGHANDGKNSAADGWGQFEMTKSVLPGRVNWRELTNFF